MRRSGTSPCTDAVGAVTQLGEAQRDEVVDRRRADSRALRWIHPVREVEDVERADDALDGAGRLGSRPSASLGGGHDRRRSTASLQAPFDGLLPAGAHRPEATQRSRRWRARQAAHEVVPDPCSRPGERGHVDDDPHQDCAKRGVYATSIDPRLFGSLFRPRLRVRFRGSIWAQLSMSRDPGPIPMGMWYTVVFSVLLARRRMSATTPCFSSRSRPVGLLLECPPIGLAKPLLPCRPRRYGSRFLPSAPAALVMATHLVALLVMFPALVPINLVLSRRLARPSGSSSTRHSPGRGDEWPRTHRPITPTSSSGTSNTSSPRCFYRGFS